jgi:cell division protein FtsN
MDITGYIRDLLYLHDCVIIPGFGGFVANYKPAEIDFAQNRFAPPSKTIGFNRVLSHNDGLLISYISGQTGLGYVDVKRNVDDFVSSAMKRLEGGKKIAMEEIGMFFYDGQKNLQFEPDMSVNYLVDSYGLSWYHYAPLESYDVKKRVRKQFQDHEPAERKGLSRTAKRILIGIPFLVALALIPLRINYLDNQKKDFSSFSPVEKSNMTIAQPKTSPSTNETTARYEEAVQQTAAEQPGEIKIAENPVAQTGQGSKEMAMNLSEENLQYFIIAGSFQSEQNAKRMHEEILSEGISSRILANPQGLFRVTLGEYPDRQSAVLALNRFRKIPGRQDAWLLKY